MGPIRVVKRRIAEAADPEHQPIGVRGGGRQQNRVADLDGLTVPVP